MADLVPYDPAQAFLSRFSKYGREQAVANAQQKYDEAVQNIRKTGITSRGLGATGALGVGALGAVQQLGQDQPLGAAAATVGSIGASAIAQNLVKGIPGPWGGVARIAAPIAASFLGGNLAASGAEGLKNMVTGQQTGKKPETQKTEAPYFSFHSQAYPKNSSLLNDDFVIPLSLSIPTTFASVAIDA